MALTRDVTTEAASANRHPLNDFWGTLEDINERSQAQRANPSKSTTFIVFDMSDIEVIAANEPYNFNVTKVEIPELNMSNTSWEAFKESLRKCGFSGSLNDLITKRLHWQWADALLSQREEKVNEDGTKSFTYPVKSGKCWQVIEIEGVENTSNKLLDAACEIANGKTDSQFKTDFMSNNDIRTLTGYSDLLMSVVNNQALDMLVSAGKLTFDGTVYHKA